jgi:hypothetical protein
MHRHEMQQSNIYLGIYIIVFYFFWKIRVLQWSLLLQLQKLLLEVGDSLRPLLKLGVLRLDGVLRMYDRVGTGVYLLMCNVEMPMDEVSPMLSLTKTVVHSLQLQVHLRRLTCPTMEDSILTLKPLHHV